MKIVCQSCSATYKIADDKVQGKKVFKIKCKKCGEDILVRGTDAQAPVEQAPAARSMEDESARGLAGAADQGTEAIWHAVINGDQHGPYSVDQFRDLLAQGNLDAETYVWRDGFDGWLPMHEVVELAWMLTPAAPEAAAPVQASYAPQAYSVPAPAAAPEPAHHEPEADLFGGSTVAMQSPVIPPAGSDLFAPVAPPMAAAPVAAAPAASISSAPAKTRPSAKSLSGDLFAAEARAQEAARPLVPDAMPEPAESSASSASSGSGGATGTRNENSVLFSLATLQQLSGGPANGSAPAQGSAQSDSSGLIDINKLAGALNNAPGSRRAAVDDILSVGTSGLGSPLSAPMLMPVAVPAPIASPAMEPHEPQGVNKTWLVTGIAVAGILVLGGLGGAMILRGHPAEAPPAANAVAVNTPPPVANPPGGANAAANAPPVAAPAPAAAQPEGTTPAAAPPGTAPAPAPAGTAPAAVHERPRERPTHASNGEAPALAHMPSPSPAPAASPPPSRPAAHTGGGSLEDLMGQVAGGGGGSPHPAPRPAPSGGGGGGGDLPATPSRSDVISAMHDVQPSVRSCGAGQGGMAMVTVVFAGSGRVTTATVASPFGGTPVGTCVARAVRSAHLPSFSNQTFNVTYPFPLQ